MGRQGAAYSGEEAATQLCSIRSAQTFNVHIQVVLVDFENQCNGALAGVHQLRGAVDVKARIRRNAVCRLGFQVEMVLSSKFEFAFDNWIRVRETLWNDIYVCFRCSSAGWLRPSDSPRYLQHCRRWQPGTCHEAKTTSLWSHLEWSGLASWCLRIRLSPGRWPSPRCIL